LHAAAWLLPVSKEGVKLPQGLPGWQAFRLAASPVWPYLDVQIAEWYNAALSSISALTTVLFVVGSTWVVLFGSRVVRRVAAWIAASAFVINAHWFTRPASDQMELRVGYFLWWLSFPLLASGLFDLSRQEDNRRLHQESAP
jgi:hypothetical protein